MLHQLRGLADGSGPSRQLQALQVQAGSGSGSLQTDAAPRKTASRAVIQGLFLAEAGRDIEEDNSTLRKEWVLAKEEGRNADKAAIAELQQRQARSTMRAPALIPIGWTPEQGYEEEVSGRVGYRYAVRLFQSHGREIADLFLDNYMPGSNPALPVAVLKTLKEAGVLKTSVHAYRDSSYGANGVIFYFSLFRTGPAFGEWHVHWEAKNKAGNPGWKKGRDGVKTPTGDEMRPVLGDFWGRTTNTGGTFE